MNANSFAHILLIGCGKMGSAMLAGWQRAAAFSASRFTIVEPNADSIAAFTSAKNIRIISSLKELGNEIPDAVILAVKPQMMDQVLPDLTGNLTSQTTVISIAAGKPTSYFARALGEQTPIIRAMPNTPGIIGAGVTVLYSRTKAINNKAQIEQLFSVLGSTFWLEDESLMDAVTAISGSGPAYLFLLMECLEQAGRDAGLPQALAEQLAILTVYGSGKLAKESTEKPEKLRHNVTSPGGTTEAALKVLLQHDALKSLIQNAVLAAIQRSKELA